MSVEIEKDVQGVIDQFVAQQQSFISTDVYCKLGQHFDDSENPIHEQVRAAYSTDLMPNYLCKWVKLRLEGGGFMQCWKYYLPVAEVQRYELRMREDGRAELSKRILGRFSLLECDLGYTITEGKIVYRLSSGEEEHIVNAGNRITIPAKMFRTANLSNGTPLKALVYPNRIEIVKG